MMMIPLVQVSNDDPSRTALRMPKGIEMRYAISVDHRPKVIDTGIFSRIRSITLVDRK